MRRWFAGLSIGAALVAAGWTGNRPSGASTDSQAVTLRAEDGVSLAATLRLPPRTPAPAVILVHMQTRTRADWEEVAARLAEAGVAALAFDLRGHGASGAGTAGADLSQNMSPSLLDVKAARAFLSKRLDIYNARIGMSGASVGANLALAAAAGDPTVRSIALLSAGIDYRGIRGDAAMRKYGDRPALLLASIEDPYATRSARELASLGGGLRELRLLSGAGHGTVMLARQPDLSEALVDWFRRTLL